MHSGCFGGLIAPSEALEILLRLEKLQEVRDVLIVGPDFARATTGALIQCIRSALHRRGEASLPATQVVVLRFAVTPCRKLAPPMAEATAVTADGCRLW